MVCWSITNEDIQWWLRWYWGVLNVGCYENVLYRLHQLSRQHGTWMHCFLTEKWSTIRTRSRVPSSILLNQIQNQNHHMNRSLHQNHGQSLNQILISQCNLGNLRIHNLHHLKMITTLFWSNGSTTRGRSKRSERSKSSTWTTSGGGSDGPEASTILKRLFFVSTQ